MLRVLPWLSICVGMVVPCDLRVFIGAGAPGQYHEASV